MTNDNFTTLLAVDLNEEFMEFNFNEDGLVQDNDYYEDEFIQALSKTEECYECDESVNFDRIDKLSNLGINVFASISETDVWISGIN
jgi:hypothetical protein